MMVLVVKADSLFCDGLVLSISTNMDMLIKTFCRTMGWVKECESYCKEINIYGNPLLNK